MNNLKPLFNENEIRVRIQEIAEEINRDYKCKDVLVIGILKGACMFFADLIRLIDLPVKVDFIIASSYVKNKSSGEVQIHSKMNETIKNKDILIVEDIVDTGLTTSHLIEMISEEMPKSLKVCALLNKKEGRKVEVPIEYVGFEISNLFVVGYGMDHENKFRNIPYIAVLENTI